MIRMQDGPWQISYRRKEPLYGKRFLFLCGKSTRSPTYEQAHMGLDLFTLVSSFYYIWTNECVIC